MFLKKLRGTPEEKRLDQILNQYSNYKIPEPIAQQTWEKTEKFWRGFLAIIQMGVGLDMSISDLKIARYKEEFEYHLGLLTRNVFLLGLEFGQDPMTEEVRTYIKIVSKPLNEIMEEHIRKFCRAAGDGATEPSKFREHQFAKLLEIVMHSYKAGVDSRST